MQTSPNLGDNEDLQSDAGFTGGSAGGRNMLGTNEADLRYSMLGIRHSSFFEADTARWYKTKS